ncbi:MAG: hypothetical protein WCG99_02160 [Candidatus Berkelbacteria bacterium]
MIPIPPCEEVGPELTATWFGNEVRGCPLLISIRGKKIYLLVYERGCLVITSEDFMLDAARLLLDIAPSINEGQMVGADSS